MKNFTLLFTSAAFVTSSFADTPAEHAQRQLVGASLAAPLNTTAVAEEKLDSFVRVNATIQTFNAGQPWQRNKPTRRSGLGTVISPTEILTTAEMVANQTYLELESADSSESIQAKVLAIDYQANLALLAPADPEKPGFLAEKTPLEIAAPASIGDSVKVWQFESNGSVLQTPATIRAVDTSSTFVSGASFLTYILKGSMQSASSSFTLPVTRDGKLIAVLTSYDSKDQTSAVTAPEVIATFLRDARDGAYEGFPSLGIGTQRTEDRSFRDFLGLSDDEGGLYISVVKEDSPAGNAGLKEGDVLLSVSGSAIDRKGYFQHPSYGPLPWTVLIRAEKNSGDEVQFTVLRNGEKMDLTATLAAPEPPLVPSHINDSPPNFLIKGGIVFQELSRTYLQAYGKEWTTRAPLALMHVMETPEDYEEERTSLVFLARVIPNPATIGYDQLGAMIVNKANGKPVPNLAALAAALGETPASGIHTIELDDAPGVIYLDATMSDAVDQQLLQSGLPNLSRIAD